MKRSVIQYKIVQASCCDTNQIYVRKRLNLHLYEMAEIINSPYMIVIMILISHTCLCEGTLHRRLMEINQELNDRELLHVNQKARLHSHGKTLAIFHFCFVR